MTATPNAIPAGPASVEADPERRRRRRKILALLLLLLALVLLALVIIWYLLFRQPIPLPVIPVDPLPSYATSIYGADDPAGVAVTGSGDRIYVAETGGERVVRVFSAGGVELGVLRPPATTGPEHVPVYVALHPTTGDVYVSDRPTGAIHVYDREGVYLREFRPADVVGAWQPIGLLVDADGNVFVTDVAGDHRVLKFDPSGALVHTFGLEQGLLFPNGVAVDADGRLYVTDSNNGRLLVFAADGALVATIGRGAGAGNLGLPRGIAIDPAGRVFVVDSSGQGVTVYSTLEEGATTPEYLGFFGGQGLADGQFSFPMGVAVDDRGRVYVADTSNDRVQVWSY